MEIDITKLNQNIETSINLDQNVQIPKEYLENSGINDLKNVHITGTITLDEERNIQINLEVTGTMILEDSISLEEENYDFCLEIDEKVEKNLKNLENSLDILDILWQNIVLEVPLRFTTVTDYSKFKGEGWKLLSEEEVETSNNPFEDLKSMFGKE